MNPNEYPVPVAVGNCAIHGTYSPTSAGGCPQCGGIAFSIAVGAAPGPEICAECGHPDCEGTHVPQTPPGIVLDASGVPIASLGPEPSEAVGVPHDASAADIEAAGFRVVSHYTLEDVERDIASGAHRLEILPSGTIVERQVADHVAPAAAGEPPTWAVSTEEYLAAPDVWLAKVRAGDVVRIVDGIVVRAILSQPRNELAAPSAEREGLADKEIDRAVGDLITMASDYISPRWTDLERREVAAIFGARLERFAAALRARPGEGT